MQGLDLLRPQSLKIKQAQQTLGKFRAQVLMKFQHARRCELMQLVAQCFADALDPLKFVVLGELHDVAIVRHHGLCAMTIGPHLERILILELEQKSDLLKHGSHLLTSHARNLAPMRKRVKPAASQLTDSTFRQICSRSHADQTPASSFGSGRWVSKSSSSLSDFFTTLTESPALTSPRRMASASGSSRNLSTARRIGRAP